jgi:hypothetical protein
MFDIKENDSKYIRRLKVLGDEEKDILLNRYISDSEFFILHCIYLMLLIV